MAKYFSNEQQFLGATPPTPPGDEALGGRNRVYRATINLDGPKLSPSQDGAGVTTADVVSLCKVPAGMRFVKGCITSSVSLGGSTISVGNATAAGKYRAAAVFTAVDTPTLFGTAAGMDVSYLTAEQSIILTTAAAALPNGADNTLIVDLYFGNA